MAGRGVSRDPEPAGWVGFYLLGSVPEPFTTYREVRALPAGSFVSIEQRGLRAPTQYHSIATIYSQAQERPLSATAKKEVKALVREALLDSVRHHLVADVPVGAFLSAGEDSGRANRLMRHTGPQANQAHPRALSELPPPPN